MLLQDVRWGSMQMLKDPNACGPYHSLAHRSISLVHLPNFQNDVLIAAAPDN
jgi:hypothetical protein